MSTLLVTVAQRLKQARLDRSAQVGAQITLAAVADEMGVSPVTVSRWEDGSRTPDNDDLVSLAIVYMTTPEWLAFGRGERTITLDAAGAASQKAVQATTGNQQRPPRRRAAGRG